MSSSKPRSGSGSVFMRERVRRVFREFAGALAGEEEPVHQVRVAGRRLRVALPLLAQKPEGRRVRKARKILRDLTGAAGAGRDLDVLMTLYEERLGALEKVSAEQRDLRRRMKTARTRSRSGLTEGILDLDIDGLRRHLRHIRSRGTPEVETILARTRAVSERDGALVLEGLAEVGERYDPEALHALRRRIRELRYTAEVDEALRGREPAASAIWKKLQEAIGVLHDAHVLSEWLGKQAERAQARGKTDLATAAAGESAFFEDEARRLHGKLLETGPAELVARALEIITRGDSGSGTPAQGGPSRSTSVPAPRAPFRTAPRRALTSAGP